MIGHQGINFGSPEHAAEIQDAMRQMSELTGVSMDEAGRSIAAFARHMNRNIESARAATEGFHASGHSLRNPHTTPQQREHNRARNKAARKARRNHR